MRGKYDRRSIGLIVLFVALGGFVALRRAGNGQEPASEERLLSAMHEISSHTILDHVRELTSDRYQGRLTGTAGYDAAAKWTIGLLSDWKIRPRGENGTYLQRFANPYTIVLPGAQLIFGDPSGNQAVETKSYSYETDFFPGATSDTGTVTAAVVYVGFGITAPELSFDEYEGIDAQGKIVLVEPEVPVSSDREVEEFKRWRPYSFHDYKVGNAKGHGAAGMVYAYHIANPNCIFVKDFLLTYVGRTVVDDLFLGSGVTHSDTLQRIRTGRKPASFETGKVLTIKNVSEHHPEGVGANVIGWMEGVDPVFREEVIIVGAHLDHLGMSHELMPGANDNASGVGVLLAAAEAVAKCGIPLRRSVAFILFGAEEQGVKGSEYYVAHPAFPNERVKGFINLESVGRGDRIIGGAGQNFPGLWEYFDSNNRKYIHRQLSATFSTNLGRPRQDAAHFLWAEIPSISFGASGGKDLPYPTYHTTKDRIETLTPGIMEDLARLVFLGVMEIANSTAPAHLQAR